MFLEFLDLQVSYRMRVSYTGHTHASGSVRKLFSLKPSITLSIHRYYRKKPGHQMSSRHEYMRIGSVTIGRELHVGLCMNFLKKAHIAKKCRAPPMWKKCAKHDKTCVHKRSPTKEMDETHVEALSVRQQVLV